MSVAGWIFFALAIAGIAYVLFAGACLAVFGARRSNERASPAGVTILKPLCGDEPRLFENLSSFCNQDHDNVQVLFGVRDASDTAIPVAERVRARFSDRDVSLIVDPRVRVANLKVANLMNMMEHAKHDVLFLADSDTAVDPQYVRRVAGALADPATGAVTCLYRGIPRCGAISALGSLFINEQFVPSVLVAAALGPMDFCLGATIAMRRSALERIGGFEAVGSYLADDRMLGKLMHDAGLKVVLSSYVVDHDVNEEDLPSLWSHELRWARTMFLARPAGYALSFVMFAVPLALLFWAISKELVLGASLTLAAVAARLILHYTARAVLRCSGPDGVWLLPARGVLAVCLWAATFFGRTVRWRDRTVRVDFSGRIVR